MSTKIMTHTAYGIKNQDRMIGWSFLGAYTICEDISENDGTRKVSLARELPEAMRGLGVPPECLVKIEKTLIELIEQAWRCPDRGGREFSAVVRLFWQEKAEQYMGQTAIMDLSNMDTHGAWGYFLIDKTGDPLGKVFERSQCFIDLYLYKDGE